MLNQNIVTKNLLRNVFIVAQRFIKNKNPQKKYSFWGFSTLILQKF